MGVAGVAIATLISQSLAAILVMLHLISEEIFYKSSIK